MDHPSEIRAIIEDIKRFRDARDWAQFHDARNLAMCLNVEAAELLEVFLWKAPERADAGRVKEELADVLTEIQNIDTSAHEAQFELAKLWLQKNDKPKAYAYLSTALELAPLNQSYQRLLPHAIHSKLQIAKHFKLLQELAARPETSRSKVENADLFLLLAQGYAAQNQFDKAAEDYAIAYKLDPKPLLGDRDAVMAAYRGKNFPLTAELADRFIEVNPDFDKEIRQIVSDAADFAESAPEPELQKLEIIMDAHLMIVQVLVIHHAALDRPVEGRESVRLGYQRIRNSVPGQIVAQEQPRYSEALHLLLRGIHVGQQITGRDAVGFAQVRHTHSEQPSELLEPAASE